MSTRFSPTVGARRPATWSTIKTGTAHGLPGPAPATGARCTGCPARQRAAPSWTAGRPRSCCTPGGRSGSPTSSCSARALLHGHRRLAGPDQHRRRRAGREYVAEAVPRHMVQPATGAWPPKVPATYALRHSPAMAVCEFSHRTDRSAAALPRRDTGSPGRECLGMSRVQELKSLEGEHAYDRIQRCRRGAARS